MTRAWHARGAAGVAVRGIELAEDPRGVRVRPTEFFCSFSRFILYLSVSEDAGVRVCVLQYVIRLLFFAGKEPGRKNS